MSKKILLKIDRCTQCFYLTKRGEYTGWCEKLKKFITKYDIDIDLITEVHEDCPLPKWEEKT